MLFTHDTEVALAAAAALVNTMPGSVPGDRDPDRLTSLDELEALYREPGLDRPLRPRCRRARGGPGPAAPAARLLGARRGRRRRPRQRPARRGPRRPPARRPRRRRVARPRDTRRRPAPPADGRRGSDRGHRRRAGRRARPAPRVRGGRLRRRRRRPLAQPLAPLLRGRLRGARPHRRLPRPPVRAPAPEDPPRTEGRMPRARAPRHTPSVLCRSRQTATRAFGGSTGGEAPVCQALPSKRLVTEPSSKTSLIAIETSGAMERTSSLSKRRSSGIGRVLVTMTSSTLHALRRSTAGPERIACVAAMMTRRGALVHEGVGGLGDGARGVDHVVDEHADAALDLTDDAVGDDLVGPVDVARLVDEGERGAAEA